MPTNFDRDLFLRMNDEALTAHCRVEFTKGTGNGGQKRNKTSSAVRLTFLPVPELAVYDCAERSQHRNRQAALGKLRLELARRYRRQPAEAPELPECARTHELYALMLARLLDVLYEEALEYHAAAARCNVTPTKFLKLLARDRAACEQYQRARQARGLGKLLLPQ